MRIGQPMNRLSICSDPLVHLLLIELYEMVFSFYDALPALFGQVQGL